MNRTWWRPASLPLKLRLCALDRTLGLKPFASTCLRLTSAYYLLSLLLIAPDVASPSTPHSVFVQDFGLILLGIPLFVLPLLSLRAKLVAARSEKVAWINARFHRVMQRVESHGDSELPPGLQDEFLSIDKIQKEIQSIKTWPFDVGVVAKLLTILLSVTAILLAGVIRKYLGF